jgi:2-polyprenyl-3-methyl-5-hydroxy-6-metoxy-1,4-benzoquinol methylase
MRRAAVLTHFRGRLRRNAWNCVCDGHERSHIVKPTGERYLPNMIDPYISYEHWHRYLFAEPFIRGKDVLDVACGEGYGSNFLAGSAARVVGVDIDGEAVRHATATYSRPNLEFITGSCENLPIDGRQLFDAIVSFETIEHLTSEAQMGFAQHLKRLLKPNGVLLISSPNRAIYTERYNHKNVFHLHEFDQSEFVDYLHKYFVNVQLLSQRVYPISYIWNMTTSSAAYTEHQIEFRGQVYAPVAEDDKERRYFLAVCSDQPLTPVLSSIMIDLSDSAIRFPTEHAAHLERALSQERERAAILAQSHAACETDWKKREEGAQAKEQEWRSSFRALTSEVEHYRRITTDIARSRTWRWANQIRRWLTPLIPLVRRCIR